jgi:hypothetical protein
MIRKAAARIDKNRKSIAGWIDERRRILVARIDERRRILGAWIDERRRILAAWIGERRGIVTPRIDDTHRQIVTLGAKCLRHINALLGLANRDGNAPVETLGSGEDEDEDSTLPVAKNPNKARVFFGQVVPSLVILAVVGFGGFAIQRVYLGDAATAARRDADEAKSSVREEKLWRAMELCEQRLAASVALHLKVRRPIDPCATPRP